MKKLLILALVSIPIAVLAVFATGAYNVHQRKVSAAAVSRQASVDATAEALKVEQAAHAKVSAEYSALHLECQKGSASWQQLSKATQLKIPMPVCGPVIAN